MWKRRRISMKIIKWDRRKFMKYFGDNDYDYDNIADILLILRNGKYSVYVRLKDFKQYSEFATDEFDRDFKDW